MRRGIRILFNFDPPADDEELRAAARQFVRKLSGFVHPSRANQAAFETAVDEVAGSARRLMASLTTQQPPRDRAVEAQHARGRAQRRLA
jgi:hypothetical protein